MTANITRLTVALGERSYPISIGAGLLADRELLQGAIVGEQVLLVSNETVAPLYLERLRESLSGKSVGCVILPDGEEHKHLATVQTIYDALIDARHNRGTTLIALGGGVVGDITGFAAASYQRGVNFVQLPTTLLAQVDSSVGGKTGVNHPQGKNMIGAFHQPVAVVIDTDTLASLPLREFRSGLAEVIKYGLICDAEFFFWLEDNLPRLLAREEEALQYAIARCCQAKADVVAADEREGGVRAILNLGHTFGHAIETATQYRCWLHGEAVAFGIILALDLSRRLGLIDAETSARGERLIEAAGLPIAPPEGLPGVDGIIELMGMDKKVIDGALRLVLLRAIGDAFVSADFPLQTLQETLTSGLGRLG